MAKTTGPLLSFDASGTTGKVMTASKWKGRTYMRLRVIPKNPKSDDQAGLRTVFGAVAKNAKQILPASDLYTQIVAVTPQDQSWISYLAKVTIGPNGDDFAAAKTAYNLMGNATVKGYFDAAAPTVGLSGFELPYGTYGAVSAGLQLWACAYAAFRLGLAIAPVTPASMSETQVNDFAAAYQP